jgi:DNA-binding transcriptional MerR regulator/methylmalonyl-CoA mutase cobalamin-binding subunit
MSIAPQRLDAIDISAVERETGISKDTLRIWEKRYGFPAPLRDAHGERAYPLEQLVRLRSIRRLIDSGLRPGQVVGATDVELAALLQQDSATAATARPEPGPVTDIALLLEQRDLPGLQSRLTSALLQLGAQRFVTEIAGPLTVKVGEMWQAGLVAVAEEHGYSELLQQLLRSVIRTDMVAAHRPRILLTTLPGETHALGLLMTQAWLASEKVRCISLGIQTPATDVAAAALGYAVNIVGISFSRIHTPLAARRQLAELRGLLDPAIVIWAGGAIWMHARKRIAGIEYIADFNELEAALGQWRAAQVGTAPRQP